MDKIACFAPKLALGRAVSTHCKRKGWLVMSFSRVFSVFARYLSLVCSFALGSAVSVGRKPSGSVSASCLDFLPSAEREAENTRLTWKILGRSAFLDSPVAVLARRCDRPGAVVPRELLWVWSPGHGRWNGS